MHCIENGVGIEVMTRATWLSIEDDVCMIRKLSRTSFLNASEIRLAGQAFFASGSDLSQPDIGKQRVHVCPMRSFSPTPAEQQSFHRVNARPRRRAEHFPESFIQLQRRAQQNT